MKSCKRAGVPVVLVYSAVPSAADGGQLVYIDPEQAEVASIVDARVSAHEFHRSNLKAVLAAAVIRQ